MVKIKSIEETVENYVASTSIAMWKYKKFLMKAKNFNEDYAIEKAIDYGLKMLRSGLGTTITPTMAMVLFREQAEINNALANVCESVENKNITP